MNIIFNVVEEDHALIKTIVKTYMAPYLRNYLLLNVKTDMT